MRQIDGLLAVDRNRPRRTGHQRVLDAGIEAIVDLAIDVPSRSTPTRELVYLRFPLMDGEGNSSWLIRGGGLLRSRELVRHGVPTLVACDGGMSRSAGDRGRSAVVPSDGRAAR